jgi:transposase-like protein
MSSTVEQSAAPVRAVLPSDVVCTPTGQPAVLVVRTGRGWTVLCAADDDWVEAHGHVSGGGQPLSLVEAMSLADLVAAELGVTPEPDRKARRAARTGSGGDPAADVPEVDPRDEEIAALRRTVGQLEHALAARVSIERAIGVLAERHGTPPREAFEELRRRARSQGRPAQELATEVLEGLPTLAGRPAAVPPSGPVAALVPAPEPRPAGAGPSARRVQRSPRRAGGGDAVPGTRS